MRVKHVLVLNIAHAVMHRLAHLLARRLGLAALLCYLLNPWLVEGLAASPQHSANQTKPTKIDITNRLTLAKTQQIAAKTTAVSVFTPPKSLRCPQFSQFAQQDSAQMPLPTQRLAALLPKPLHQARQVHIHLRCLEAHGALKQAEALYELAIQKNSGALALHYFGLARLLFAQKRYVAASTALSKLSRHPHARWHDAAVHTWLYATAKRANALAPTEKTRVSQGMLRVANAYYANAEPDKNHQPLLKILLAFAQKQNNVPMARQLSRWLWRNPYTKQDIAYATKALKRWLPHYAPTLPHLHSRIRGVFRLREYTGVQHEIQALLRAKRFPQKGKASQAQAIGRYYIRSVLRLKHYRHASQVLNSKKWQKAFQFSPVQSQFWRVQVALNQGNLPAALRHFKRLQKQAPQAKWLPKLTLRIAKLQRARGKSKAFYTTIQTLFTQFPASQHTANACWEAVWGHYLRKNTRASLRWVERCLGTSKVWEPIYGTRLLYWKGRMLANQGHTQKAKALWQHLQSNHPYNFYTLLASYALAPPLQATVEATFAGLAAHKLPALPALPTRLDALFQLPVFSHALFLLSLNLRQEATGAFKSMRWNRLSRPAVEQALGLFEAMEMHHQLIVLLANKRWGTLLSSTIQSSALWRRSHPLAYRELVFEHGEKRRVDPFFALSIMREESRFEEGVRSLVGATGLMQLMPATARDTGRRIHLNHVVQDLTNPQYNVPIGVAYLGHVLKRFNHHIVFSAAAYNAGPGRVRQWKKQFGRVPIDAFIERIPYQETRNYVRRVWLSYWVYQRIYRPAS